MGRGKENRQVKCVNKNHLFDMPSPEEPIEHASIGSASLLIVTGLFYLLLSPAATKVTNCLKTFLSWSVKNLNWKA